MISSKILKRRSVYSLRQVQTKRNGFISEWDCFLSADVCHLGSPFRLSLVLRKGREDIERANRFQLGVSTISTSISSPALNTITLHNSNPSLAATSSLRSGPLQASTVHLEDRVQMKSVEVAAHDAVSTSRTDSLRSQANETDSIHETTPSRNVSQRTRTDSFEREKEKEKDVPKKKTRKQDESLQRLLDSPDCLDEAALTLNFLLRRLFCDVFEEPLFKDLLKEKIELKLKEIAVSRTILRHSIALMRLGFSWVYWKISMSKRSRWAIHIQSFSKSNRCSGIPKESGSICLFSIEAVSSTTSTERWWLHSDFSFAIV